MAEEKEPKKGSLMGAFRDIVYGMSSHEMTRHAVRTRASMEHLFILITMGTCSASRSSPVLFAPAAPVRDATDQLLETANAARAGHHRVLG